MTSGWVNDLTGLARQVDGITWAVIAVNLLLAVFARQLLRFTFSEQLDKRTFTRRVAVFRALNLLIVIAFIYTHFYAKGDASGPGFKLLAIVIILYLAWLTSALAAEIATLP